MAVIMKMNLITIAEYNQGHDNHAPDNEADDNNDDNDDGNKDY